MTPEQELAHMEQDRDLTKAQLDHANDRIEELERKHREVALMLLNVELERNALRSQLQAAQEARREAIDGWKDALEREGEGKAEVERLRGLLAKVNEAGTLIDEYDWDLACDIRAALTPEGTPPDDSVRAAMERTSNTYYANEKVPPARNAPEGTQDD